MSVSGVMRILLSMMKYIVVCRVLSH